MIVAQNDTKNTSIKYLITSSKDKLWGFYINDLGRNVFEKYSEYPSKNHLDSYVFTGDKGLMFTLIDYLNKKQGMLLVSLEITVKSS